MLSMSQVQQMLSGGLHDVIVDAHKGGFKRYADVADEFPAVVAAFNQRERANFLHSQIRQLVEVGVESRDDAQVTSWDIDTLAVGVNLLVRFKYLGNGAPANNKSTEQQKLLDRQMYTEETMALLARAGIMEPPTMVTAGYTADGLDLGRVIIQRDCKGHERWNYDIWGGTAVTEPLKLETIEEVMPGVVVRSARQVAEEAAWREPQARRGAERDD